MSMTRAPLWMGSLFVAVAGCGEDPKPTPPAEPSSAEMRAFLGLTPGSCWTYRFDENGLGGAATVGISPPNEAVIAGKKVYVHEYLRQGLGGGVTTYLDADTTAGEVHVLRITEGAGANRIDRRYDTDPTPLFAKLTFGESGAVEYDGTVFQATSTPNVPAPGGGVMPGEPETHKWVVQSNAESVTTTDGPKDAIRLSYTRGPSSALYWLVPGYGFAKFQDFEGRIHEVCEARICTEAGSCTGPDSCIATCPL